MVARCSWSFAKQLQVTKAAATVSCWVHTLAGVLRRGLVRHADSQRYSAELVSHPHTVTHHHKQPAIHTPDAVAYICCCHAQAAASADGTPASNGQLGAAAARESSRDQGPVSSCGAAATPQPADAQLASSSSSTAAAAATTIVCATLDLSHPTKSSKALGRLQLQVCLLKSMKSHTEKARHLALRLPAQRNPRNKMLCDVYVCYNCYNCRCHTSCRCRRVLLACWALCASGSTSVQLPVC